MTTAIVTSPFNTISGAPHSHRGAPSFIYADTLQDLGKEASVNTKKGHVEYDAFDEVYVYHGSDFQGALNLFGGMKDFGNIDSVIAYSKIKGIVYSLDIDHPKYSELIAPRMKGDYNPKWDLVDWNNLKRIEDTAITVKYLKYYPKVVVGDSHAISMYRRGWTVTSIPFKTLHGALKIGLNNLLPVTNCIEAEFYFGNIDVRHHLCRMDDSALINLVDEYCRQAHKIADHGINVGIYELLPIENISRALPKTGYYKGTPFYGTWGERNAKRLMFKEEVLKRCGNGVRLIEWVSGMINADGELDFKYMEKPKSIHLSRASYPHWQGIDKPSGSLESFFE